MSNIYYKTEEIRDMKKLLLVSLFFIITSISFSQTYPNFGAGALMKDAIGFNFFVGDNAKNFQTTPKALGSGLYDFSGNYNLWSFWLLRPNKYPIGVATTVGLKITKFRFVENYHFGIDTNALFIDNEPEHFYNEAFFSRHGSKLVTGKLFIPLMIYLPVHNWFNSSKDNFGIFGGAFYDGYLFAYNKLFYEQDNQLIKDKQTNNTMKNYLNKNGFGVRAGVKISSFFIFGQYMLTPIFSDILQYDIHETKIGINYYFDYAKRLSDLDNFGGDDDDDFGTDAQ